MTAMYQGEGGYMSVVGEEPMGKHPHPSIQALKQGTVGKTSSDLQLMMENERKQHEDGYRYAHGHNDDNVPLGKASF